MRYIKACGGTAALLKGWRLMTKQAAGSQDRFKSPTGETLTGRSHLARSLGLTALDAKQAQLFRFRKASVAPKPKKREFSFPQKRLLTGAASSTKGMYAFSTCQLPTVHQR